MADLFVKIDDLAGYATSFMTIAADALTAQQADVAGFAQYACAWGDDAPGMAFLGAYLDPATDTIDCLQQLPVQLAALGVAMQMTSHSYAGTETSNVDLTRGVV